MLYYYAGWLLLMNLLGLGSMCLDKLLAKKQARRIPERRLLLIAALGGCFGSTLAMYLARHKTLHRKFSLGLPLLCLLWAALCAYLLLSGSLVT